jgi:ketosteroid isomerase-like protein
MGVRRGGDSSLAKESVVAPTQPSAADTVRVVLEAVDQSDLDTIGAPTAPDVHFRFGNSEPTGTKSELLVAAQSVRAAIAGIHHEFVDIGEIGNGTVVAILDVHYRRVDGRELNRPYCNVFRVSDGLVRDYRIYMDVNGRSMRFSLVLVQVVVLAAALALYGVNPNFAFTV